MGRRRVRGLVRLARRGRIGLRDLWERVRVVWWGKSRRARAADLAQDTVRVVDPRDPVGLARWVASEGRRIDIRGFDTPDARGRMRLRELKHLSPRRRAARAGGIASHVRRRLAEYISSLDELLARLETSEPASEAEARRILGEARRELEEELRREAGAVEARLKPVALLDGRVVRVRKKGYIDYDDFRVLVRAARALGLSETARYAWEGRLSLRSGDGIDYGRLQALRSLLGLRGVEVEIEGVEPGEALRVIDRALGVRVLGDPADNRVYYRLDGEAVEELAREAGYRSDLELMRDLFSYSYVTYDPALRRRVTRVIDLFRRLDGSYIVYRGLTPRIDKLSREHGGPPLISYAPWVVGAFDAESPVRLRDYQVRAVAWILRYLARYGAATLQAATGAGKTEVAIDVISRILRARPGAKVFFVSLNSDLLRQFRARAARYGLPVGLVMSGEFDVDKPVVAATIQTLARAIEKVEREKAEIEELEDVKMDEAKLAESQYRRLYEAWRSADLVVVDEAHHVPARTVSYVLRRAPGALRLGLSATPWRDDGHDLKIYALVGDVVPFKISASYLIERGWLVPAKIMVVKVGRAPWIKRYGSWQKEASGVLNSEARARFVAGILAGLRARGLTPALVLVRYKKQAQMIAGEARRHGLRVLAVTGDLKPGERERIFRDVIEGRLDAIAATSLADEGLDLPPLRTLVVAGAGKSKTKVFQRVGRVLRKYPGKRFGLVVDIVDETEYLGGHGRERVRLYQTEKHWSIKQLDAEVPEGKEYEAGKDIAETLEL